MQTETSSSRRLRTGGARDGFGAYLRFLIDGAGRVLLPWRNAYRRESFWADLIAGLVVAVLVVPQSLAYALLAGLPPQLGLFAGVLPPLCYALFGASSSQAVGPVALTSVMTYAALAPLAAVGSPQYLHLALVLALLCGILMLIAGMLRLGFVSDLLSMPVVAGFSTGSAVLIMVSQLGNLCGMTMRGESAFAQTWSVLAGLSAANPYTLGLGLGALSLLWLARRFLTRLLVRCGLPDRAAELGSRLAPVLVVALASVLVAGYQLHLRYDVDVVGPIPAGLPPWSPVWPTLDELNLLLPAALLLSLVALVSSASVGQAFAAARAERMDTDAELRGVGLANIAAALSSGFPVAGGFSRSAVNFAAGARSPLAGVFAALGMLAVLAGATSLFETLPKAVLAAVIMLASTSLLDVATLRRAWRYDRTEAAAWLGTCTGVLVLGLVPGILIGVAWSVGVLLWRASSPHIAVLGRIAGSEHFRNVTRHQVQTLPGVLLLRVDESLFFGNARAVIERVELELRSRPEVTDVVLALSATNQIDLSGERALAQLEQQLAATGRRLHLAELKGPVADRLRGGELLTRLTGRVHLSLHEACCRLAVEGDGADSTQQR